MLQNGNNFINQTFHHTMHVFLLYKHNENSGSASFIQGGAERTDVFEKFIK